MNISYSYNDDTVTVVIDGNIDTTGGSQLNDKFQEILNNDYIKFANLDLKGVNSINSAGIGKLLRFYKHFNKCGGELKIVHVSDKLYELFKDINLDKIIAIAK